MDGATDPTSLPFAYGFWLVLNVVLHPKSRSNPNLDKVPSPMSHSCEERAPTQMEQGRLSAREPTSTSLCWLDGAFPAVSGCCCCCFLVLLHVHSDHNLHCVSCCRVQSVCCRPPSAISGSTSTHNTLVNTWLDVCWMLHVRQTVCTNMVHFQYKPGFSLVLHPVFGESVSLLPVEAPNSQHHPSEDFVHTPPSSSTEHP